MPRRALRLLIVGILGLVAGFPVANPALAEAGAGDIDRRIVLQVGPHRLSSYLLDKYQGRFADGVRQREGRPPTRAQQVAWLELFLAQQVVTAHAIHAGYDRRPAVVAMVERMERHMLAQTNLGLYRPAFKAPVPSPAAIELAYRRSRVATDATVVRFEDEADEVASVGADFLRTGLEEQTRRVLAIRGRDGVQLADGPFSWPYAPFMEIGGVIASSVPGHWTRHHEPHLGVYYILVRSEAPPREIPEAPPDSFAAYVFEVENQIAQRKEAGSRLQSVRFSLEPETIRKAVALWRLLPPAAGDLPEFADPALGALPLARYQMSDRTVRVTLDDFRRRFNERFMRHVRRQPAELRQCVEEVVLNELAVQAARVEGVDRLPRFVEDRSGFAGFQALDLFEKEMLAPAIHFSPTQVERYYREHLDSYQRVTQIRGRWLEFPTAAAASHWLREGAAALAPLRDEPIKLDLASPLGGAESSHQRFFRSPVGTKVGPFPYGPVQAVFVKEAELARAAQTLGEVSDAIRRSLLREALDQRTLALAAELAGQYEISDQIDYARYGVMRHELKLPWIR